MKTTDEKIKEFATDIVAIAQSEIGVDSKHGILNKNDLERIIAEISAKIRIEYSNLIQAKEEEQDKQKDI